MADFGNNSNDRRDLVMYVVDEPRREAGRSTYRQKWFFRYPGQTAFPPPRAEFNYDAEALFTVGEVPFILSKNRGNSGTDLYELRNPKPHQDNVLVHRGHFEIGGRVTAADASADGLRLAVATYYTLSLFERDDLSAGFFDGRISRLPFSAPQVEALCFVDESGETLLLADEEAAVLHEVAVATFEEKQL